MWRLSAPLVCVYFLSRPRTHPLLPFSAIASICSLSPRPRRCSQRPGAPPEAGARLAPALESVSSWLCPPGQCHPCAEPWGARSTGTRIPREGGEVLGVALNPVPVTNLGVLCGGGGVAGEGTRSCRQSPEDSPGFLSSAPAPSPHPTGTSCVLVGLGDSRVAVPKGGATPRAQPLVAVAVTAPLAFPSRKEKFGGEWGIFPFVCGIVGLERAPGAVGS